MHHRYILKEMWKSASKGLFLNKGKNTPLSHIAPSMLWWIGVQLLLALIHWWQNLFDLRARFTLGQPLVVVWRGDASSGCGYLMLSHTHKGPTQLHSFPPHLISVNQLRAWLLFPLHSSNDWSDNWGEVICIPILVLGSGYLSALPFCRCCQNRCVLAGGGAFA